MKPFVASLLLVLLAGCSPDVVLGGNDRVAAPADTTCDPGDFPKLAGRYDRTLVHDGLTRRYTVYVPEGFAPCGEKTKTVVVYRDDGAFLRPILPARSGPFLTLASDRGYLVVVPEASGLGLRDVWNAPLAPRTVDDVDDVGFAQALLAALPTRDERRTYAAGIGQGGTFVHTLAAATGAFAAIAVFGGTIGGRRALTGALELPPTPVAPTAALLVHGTGDNVYPFSGGAAGGLFVQSFADAVAFWTKANGCGAAEEASEGALRTQTYPCTDSRDVVAVGISGLGHEWPEQFPAVRYVSSEAALSFFDRHVR